LNGRANLPAQQESRNSRLTRTLRALSPNRRAGRGWIANRSRGR
jgi:hypothetical protein